MVGDGWLDADDLRSIERFRSTLQKIASEIDPLGSTPLGDPDVVMHSACASTGGESREKGPGFATGEARTGLPVGDDGQASSPAGFGAGAHWRAIGCHKGTSRGRFHQLMLD